MLLPVASLVVLGWVTRTPALVQGHPSFGGMVLSAAVGVLLLGLCLLAGVLRWRRRVVDAMAVALLLLSLGMLAQSVFNIDLLSWPTLHDWLADRNPHPGRAAPGTAVALSLAALVVLLRTRVKGRLLAWLVPILTFCIFTVALAGMSWQSTEIGALFQFSHAARMPVLAALSLLAGGAGLWASWQGSAWYRSGNYLNDADKLALMGVLILVVVGLSAGVAGLAAQQRLLEGELRDRFNTFLSTRVDWFWSEIASQDSQARRLAASPAIRELRKPGQMQRGAEVLEQLLAVTNDDVSALSLQDVQGNTLAVAGLPAGATALRLDLQDAPGASLLWDRRYLMRLKVPVLRNDGLLSGYLVVELPFPLVEQILSFRNRSGWESRLCVLNSEGPSCLPELPAADVAFWQRAQRVLQEGPGIARVSEGPGAGMAVQRVLLDSSGLSLMVRQGFETTYRPVRSMLGPVMLALLLFVALGGVLLWSQLRPLARRLVESEKRTREVLSRMVHERTHELEASNAALREKREELRQVAAHHERLVEEERKRIAREVHDELGGQLTAARSRISAAMRRQGGGSDPLLDEALVMVDAAVDTVRKVITDLRPSVLDQLGAWAALEWLAGQFEERSGIACTVDIAPEVQEQAPGPEQSIAIFRIVQEALTNVLKHAACSSADLRVWLQDDAYHVQVRDDGRGFGRQIGTRGGARTPRGDSWGMVGMLERAERLGGELLVQASAGQGTTITLIMPKGSQHVVPA